MKTIEEINQHNVKKILAEKKIPDFYPGDVIKVGVRIKEGKKERIQYFEGVCIAKKSRDLNSSFTVRKISFGEGVERVFPVVSPMIESFEVKRKGKVKRAKLYYLRDRRGKSARIAERTTGHGIEVQEIAVSKTERRRQKDAEKLARKERAAKEREESAKVKAEAEKAAAAEAEAAAKAEAAAAETPAEGGDENA